jgi:hypothetical protein
LGWIVVFPSGKNEIHLGVQIKIPAGIEAGAACDSPAQAISPEHAKLVATAIAFFIAEVYFATEKPWKANLAQVRLQARNIALYPTS